jgi:pantoate kinase
VAAPRARSVRARAPCHVTGIVVPETSAADPRARGSLGAGLVLTLGVRATARWRPARRPSLLVRSDHGARLAISEEVARRLVGATPGRFDVVVEHDLPIGQGFGTSAAGALATGLAVSGLVGVSRVRAVETAHLAELFGGGGLGGVAAILGGGLERRLTAGLPPFGRVARTVDPERLVVGAVGTSVPSPSVLGRRDLTRRFEAARGLLDRLGNPPEPAAYWEVAEAFTQRAGLLNRELGVVLRALRRRHARAAQAMFGRAFCANVPDGPRGRELLDWVAGHLPGARVCAVATTGARRVPLRRGQAF